MQDYIIMCAMYPTMTSGKVDKFLIKKGDKVVPGTAVAVQEGEYVEIDTAIIEIELAEPEQE